MNLYIESIEGGTYIAGVGEKKATEFLVDEYRGWFLLKLDVTYISRFSLMSQTDPQNMVS